MIVYPQITKYGGLAIKITIIDQSFTLMDVFKVFLDNNIDECLFWNPEVADYDGVFTHTDLIKVTLKCYSNVLQGNTNGNLIQCTGQAQGITTMEVEDNHIPIHPSCNGKLTIDQFNRLLADFKRINVKQWLNTDGEDLHHKVLVKAVMEDNLNDACHKILRQHVNRVVVIDKESRMVTAIIQQKDILAFLVKGFTQYFKLLTTEYNLQPMHQERNRHDQHELEIGYFYIGETPQSQTLPSTLTVFEAFHQLIYKLRRNSVPVVNMNKEYIGLVERKDFIFILKYQMFDILCNTIEYFINVLKVEKQKYAAYYLLHQEYFHMKQTVKEVVENLVISHSGSLVCLNDKKQVVEHIQISDLFEFCLDQD